MSSPAVIKFEKLELGQAINNAVAERLNAAAPDLPPLYWLLWYTSLETPRISAAVDDEQVLAQWSGALGLQPKESGIPGLRMMAGWAFVDHYRHEIELCCVVDRDAYEADRRAFQARCGR